MMGYIQKELMCGVVTICERRGKWDVYGMDAEVVIKLT